MQDYALYQVFIIIIIMIINTNTVMKQCTMQEAIWGNSLVLPIAFFVFIIIIIDITCNLEIMVLLLFCRCYLHVFYLNTTFHFPLQITLEAS